METTSEKAIDQWENEGGRIVHAADTAHDSTASANTGRPTVTDISDIHVILTELVVLLDEGH